MLSNSTPNPEGENNSEYCNMSLKMYFRTNVNLENISKMFN